MPFPCEVAIWKALPSIKSALAQALVERNLSQRKIAQLLSSTEASISYYITGKRGASIIIGKHVLEEIGKLTERIVSEQLSDDELTKEICAVCQKVRKSCAICGAKSIEECDQCSHF